MATLKQAILHKNNSLKKCSLKLKLFMLEERSELPHTAIKTSLHVDFLPCDLPRRSQCVEGDARRFLDDISHLLKAAWDMSVIHKLVVSLLTILLGIVRCGPHSILQISVGRWGACVHLCHSQKPSASKRGHLKLVCYPVDGGIGPFPKLFPRLFQYHFSHVEAPLPFFS